MTLPTDGNLKLTRIADPDGNPVALVLDGSIYRLAVDAKLDVGDIEIGAVELKDGATDTRASVKGTGTALSAGPNNGALLIAGEDTGVQRNVKVDAAGRVVTVPGSGVPNKAAITFPTVTVVAAGTPVQGPVLLIPDGFTLSVRQRVTQTGSPIGYIADSGANTAISANRAETVKGDIKTFGITNANLLFFDSDTAGTIFELTAEQ